MNSVDNRSTWPLVCVLGTYLCLFLGWLAKGMVVGSDAAQNNTGGVIGPSFIGAMGILIFCVPVMFVGVILSLAGLIKGYRIPSAVALLLYFLLGKSLIHA